MSEPAAGLRVTVWRSYSPKRALAYKPIDGEVVSHLDDEAQLQQDVFCWQTSEDIWSGLSDEALRRSFRDRLLSEFDPFRPPEERSLQSLSRYVEDLRSVATSGPSEWANSAHRFAGDDRAARFNPLLSFYNQLSWIVEVFLDVPQASVSVR